MKISNSGKPIDKILINPYWPNVDNAIIFSNHSKLAPRQAINIVKPEIGNKNSFKHTQTMYVQSQNVWN